MSQWGGNAHVQKQTPPSTGPASPALPSPTQPPSLSVQSATALDTYNNNQRPSPSSKHQRAFSADSRPSSRPISMIQTYQPPVMEVDSDTLPELQRIFTFLNNHSNKLYQEGYFLKFHDTDVRTSKPDHPSRLVTLTVSRWPPRSRPKMAGIFCSACRHHSLAMGCQRARPSRRRFRGAAILYQPHRCCNSHGKSTAHHLGAALNSTRSRP
jgi:hypothetical protein